MKTTKHIGVSLHRDYAVALRQHARETKKSITVIVEEALQPVLKVRRPAGMRREG